MLFRSDRVTVKRARIDKPGMGVVKVIFEREIPSAEGVKIAGLTTIYTIYSTGDIYVSNAFNRISAEVPETPRIGMQMQLPAQYMNLTGFGRGPHENYNDRYTSADVGLYESTVADQYVPYIRPQENGYKTDTRWLTLTDEKGVGLLIAGDPVISFAALNFEHNDFESPGKLAGYRRDAK